jgi:type I restriction enzyme S subunit
LNSAERAGLRPKGNVPTLRFPEFDGEWKKEHLKDKCSFFSGGTPSSTNKTYYDGDIPFIRSGEIASDSTELFLSESGLNNSSAKIVEKGDLLLALYGATSGQIAISQIKGAINQAILCIRSPYDKVFLKSAWEKRVEKILQAYLQGGQGNLSAEIVKNLSFHFPSLQEQIKIGQLISLIDKRIETQNRIIEDLKSERKFLLEQLFCLPKEHTPKLRLKGMTGDWYKVRLYDIVERITERNKANTCSRVLTIAAQYGLIDQQEFFNKQIASSDLTTYYLLHKGDFAYNKSYSGDYPWGAVKRLDNYNEGVLSSLYVCFRPNGNVDSDFLCHYFESTKWYRGISEISGEGARNHGLLNMSVDDYFNTIHRIPSLEEQRQISTMLNTIVQKIKIEESIIDKLQKQKSYLLKEMFV